jgi:hypothetical protein
MALARSYLGATLPASITLWAGAGWLAKSLKRRSGKDRSVMHDNKSVRRFIELRAQALPDAHIMTQGEDYFRVSCFLWFPMLCQAQPGQRQGTLPPAKANFDKEKVKFSNLYQRLAQNGLMQGKVSRVRVNRIDNRNRSSLFTKSKIGSSGKRFVYNG